MIHAAYRLWGGDGFYAKMTGTSMLSMFENTKEKVTVHIMHNDRLTNDNRDKLQQIAKQYNQRVEFHNAEKIAGATLRKFEAAHPIASGINAAWYPLIVHEVFPNLDKLIFLGADTIFNLDVAELWSYELGEYGIAGIPEIWSKVPKFHTLIMDNVVKYEDYFNTDVLILRPSFFFENLELILDGCRFIYNSKRYDQNEQDVLSYLFSKKYLKLPGKFNLHVHFLRGLKDFTHLEKAIYHFAGGDATKPSLNIDDIFNRLYFEYFLKTPWATVDMFGNLNKALEKTFGKILNDSRNMLLHVTNLLSERRRAFFVDENSREAAKQIFAIKPEETVIDLAEGGEMLIKRMNENKGKILLFVLTTNYWQVRNFLLSKNFVEGTDFINGFLFLSERQGFKINFDSKPIVQEI